MFISRKRLKSLEDRITKLEQDSEVLSFDNGKVTLKKLVQLFESFSNEVRKNRQL